MNDHPKIITLRVILQVSIFLIILPGLPLIISRRWDWWQAWAYALLTTLSFIISRLIAAQRHPDLIAERSRFMQHENVKSWDHDPKYDTNFGNFYPALIELCFLNDRINPGVVIALKRKAGPVQDLSNLIGPLHKSRM